VEIRTYELGQAEVVALAGQLHLREVRRVMETFVEVLRSDKPVVVVDLRELAYLSSAGLTTLFRVYKRAVQRGKGIGFVRARQEVQKILDLSGLSRLFDLYDTPAEAAKLPRV